MTRFDRTALLLLLGGLGLGLLSRSDRDSALAAAVSGGEAPTSSPAPGDYFAVAPCRVADTRNSPGPSGGPALGANTVRSFPVTGICGIPSSATAVAINLAVFLPSDVGDLRVYPAGGTAPLASAINFRPGIVRANNAIVPLGAGGQVSVQCDMASSGSTDFFFDVYGYFQSNTLTQTATPTSTASNTPTLTPTNTPTPTPTNTPTNTPSAPTSTPTNTPTRTPTNTPTLTPTNTPTPTPTNTPTNTPSAPTNTPTNTPTRTPTNTPTLTPTCSTITVTNPGTTTGTVDAAFGQTFTQTGAAGTATFTLNSGSLPAGLGPLATNGTLSGTPGQPGAFDITVKVTDANGCTGVGSNYHLVIACQTITVNNPATTGAVYNTAFSQTFTQSGVGTHTPASFTLNSGSLPTGLMLHSTTGVLDGTPTVTGTFPITVKVTDVNGCTGTGSTYNLTVAPQAVADSYSGLVDNTQFVVTGGTTSTPSTPSVQTNGAVTFRLTNNDLPSGAVSISTGTFATSQTGSVTIAADGTFLYTPPARPTLPAITSDTFNYTISSNTGATATPATAIGSVSLNLGGRVWYVRNNGAAGNGQAQSPFNLLSAAIAASTANDNIFVYQGDATTTNLATASILKAGQTFIGEGAALVVNGNTLVAAGGFPLIGNTLTLANSVTVKGIDMSTGPANAITGSSVTGISVTARAVTTTTGTPLTLGGSGNTGAMTFASISCNGAANGINVANYSGGTLTVNGKFPSDPADTTRGNTTVGLGGTIAVGDGGTIQGTTGSGIIVDGTGAVVLRSMKIFSPSAGQGVNSGSNGITATNVNGLTLDNVFINGFTGNSGLRGTGLANLSMQHTDVDGNGTAVGTETNNNWNVRIAELAGDCGDVTNGCRWSNSLFFNSRENIVGITQGLANPTISTTMTVSNSEFRDTTLTTSPSNDAFVISAFGSAVTNLTATGSTFKNVEVAGFQYDGNDDSSGTVNVRNSSFENTGSDIFIVHNGGSPTTGKTLNFDVSGNTERQLTGNPASSAAIDVFLAGNSNSGSLMVGKIENNTIGNLSVSGSGSHAGHGIGLNATGAGTMTTTVTGNTVHQIHQDSVFFAEANSGSARVNAYVHNNSFNSDQSGTGLDALEVTGGAVGTDTATVCVDMAANTLLGDPTYTSVVLQTFGASTSGINLVGLSTTFNDDTTGIANFVGSNPVTTPAGVNTSALPIPSSAFMVVGGGHILGASTCGVTFPP